MVSFLPSLCPPTLKGDLIYEGFSITKIVIFILFLSFDYLHYQG